MFGTKGPGSFDLTLHTHGAGPGTTDVDYFRFDVPNLGAINVPRVRITSDEKVDVTLFAADRTEVGRATGKREVKWGLRAGQDRLSPRERRHPHALHALDGTHAQPGVPPEYEQELEILPPWWDGPRPNWFDEMLDRRAVIIDETVLGDGVLVLGSASGGVLPEDVRRRACSTGPVRRSARASRSAAPAGSTSPASNPGPSRCASRQRRARRSACSSRRPARRSDDGPEIARG